MIKFLFYTITLWLALISNIHAESYIREYTYTASEADSKLTSRIIALDQVKILLLQELGTHIQQEINISRNGNGDMFASDDIEAFTAGFTKVDIIDEKWNGKIYYLKAKIEANTKDVLNALEEFKNNKTADDEKNLEALKDNQRSLKEARQKIKTLQNQLKETNNYAQSKEVIDRYAKSINSISKLLINTRVPDIIENGAVVPFFVNFSPSVQNGDEIYILVGNTKLAYTFKPKGNVMLSHISGRVKNRFGNMTVIVKRFDNNVFKETVALQGHIYNQFPDGPNKTAKCKTRASGNNIKMLCLNNMARINYINIVDIILENGSVEVGMTPNASANPFLWVTGNFDASKNQTHPSITMSPFSDEDFSISLMN